MAKLNPCGFSMNHMLNIMRIENEASSAKKTLMSPLAAGHDLADGEVVKARVPGFVRKRTDPEMGINKKGDPAPNTLFTPEMYTGLSIPALTDRERLFLQYVHNRRFADTDRFPWAPGAAFKILPGPNDQNREWLGKMADGGLAVDCGPSGTTDELLQAADFVGVTLDEYGACLMRDAALGNMLLQEHHSYAEVAQGASAADRATPKFSWDAPYEALKGCPTRSPTHGSSLGAIASPFPAPSGVTARTHTTGSLPPALSKNRWAQALDVYTSMTPTSALNAAVLSSDFDSRMTGQ